MDTWMDRWIDGSLIQLVSSCSTIIRMATIGVTLYCTVSAFLQRSTHQTTCNTY